MFTDRTAAGQELISRIADRNYCNPIIVAIPQGGVPVAQPIAYYFGLPIDLCFVAKIKWYFDPRYGIGATENDGEVILNNEAIDMLALNDDEVSIASTIARNDLIQTISILEPFDHMPKNLSGSTAIIIDDGIASGFTALAAVKSLNKHNPNRLVVATPVSSIYARRILAKAGIEVVSIISDNNQMFLVDDFYVDFNKLTLDRICLLLEQHPFKSSRRDSPRRRILNAIGE